MPAELDEIALELVVMLAVFVDMTLELLLIPEEFV